MRAWCALALATVASCYRTVTGAPPGTPPLVIEIPSSTVTEVLPVSVRWEARCEETWRWLDIAVHSSGDKDLGKDYDLDVGVGESTESIACKQQKFSVRASCVPGPCTIVEGRQGRKTRTLAIAFGAAGTHDVTLVVDNGEIRKSWTTAVDVVVADAIRIGCSTWEGDQQRPCVGRAFRPGSTFAFTAAAFARGKPLAETPKLDTKGPFVRLDDGRYQAGMPGTYFVHASYDGLVADLTIVVDP